MRCEGKENIITGPEKAGDTRDARGRFTPETDLCGVTPVLLPGWRVGYRVGPRGAIYADMAVAMRHARKRTEYYGSAS